MDFLPVNFGSNFGKSVMKAVLHGGKNSKIILLIFIKQLNKHTIRNFHSISPLYVPHCIF